MKLILLCVVVGSLLVTVLSAIDCPNGVFLSPEGNDTSGNGSFTSPFRSFQRSLEHVYQSGNHSAVICLLAGTYHDLPQGEYSIGPFDSIVLVPADKSDPLPLIQEAFYYLNNTAYFEFGLFNIHRVVISSSNTNIYLHDLHTYNTDKDAGITIFPQGSTQTNTLKAERLLGLSLDVSVDGGDVLSSVSVDSSYLFYTHIDHSNNVTISNSHLQAEVSVKASTISINNCECSHLNYTLNTLHFISLLPLDQSLTINFNSNRFINNTFYYTDATDLLLVDTVAYTLNYENNYFSCNYGYATSTKVSHLLPLLPHSLSDRVTAKIVGNVVDQTCPSTCPTGQSPIYQGLTCTTNPSPASVSPGLIGGICGAILLLIVFGVFFAFYRKKQYTQLT